MADMATTRLRPNTSHSGSVLVCRTNAYHMPLKLATSGTLSVKMRRRGGEALLMVRFAGPPTVRRSKVIADSWDQEALDSGRSEHSVLVAVPPGCEGVYIAVHNLPTRQPRETCFYTLVTHVETTAPPLLGERLRTSVPRTPSALTALRGSVSARCSVDAAEYRPSTPRTTAALSSMAATPNRAEPSTTRSSAAPACCL